MTNNIIIVGVGGQGTLLASRILGAVMQDLGYDVKVSEVHGMSQRGGSVVTYVRYGEKVNSPLVPVDEADVILAFELLEAYRWFPHLKKGGTIIINDQKILPMPVITGVAVYPDNIIDKIKQTDAKVISLDALKAATEAGSSKAVNVVLLGVFAAISGIDIEIWKKALQNTVPPKFLELNKKAFQFGIDAANPS